MGPLRSYDPWTPASAGETVEGLSTLRSETGTLARSNASSEPAYTAGVARLEAIMD